MSIETFIAYIMTTLCPPAKTDPNAGPISSNAQAATGRERRTAFLAAVAQNQAIRAYEHPRTTESYYPERDAQEMF